MPAKPAKIEFSRALDAAPRDRQLNMLVPTGNPADPLSREIAWWDGALGRWEGDWRYDDVEGNWASAEPIAWAPLVEIGDALHREFADKAAADIAARAKVAALPAPKPKPVDKRPAKGQRGVDMTTGKPVAGVKLKAAKRPETFEAA